MQPGLYNNKGNLIANWEKLVDDGILLTIRDGFLMIAHDKPDKEEICYTKNILNKYVRGNDNKLVLSDDIFVIGSNAFSNCDFLSEIILPKNLELIGQKLSIIVQI